MSSGSGMVMGMTEKLKASFKAAGRGLKDALLHSNHGALIHSDHAALYNARTVATLIDLLISQTHPERKGRAEGVERKEFSPRKRLFLWTGT